MITSAFLLMIYWHQVAVWQKSLGVTGIWSKRLGITAAIFLIVYVIALGVEGDLFRLQRRIGVILYFTLTYLAQLLAVSWLYRRGYISPATRTMLVISALLLIIGLSSVLIDIFTDWQDEVEHAFEWVLALLIHLQFIVSYWVYEGYPFREINHSSSSS